MEQFKFQTDLSNLDERSIFANRICKLIYEKHNGNLNHAIKEAKPFFIELEELISNIYELIDTEIPLFAFYLLKVQGADNWGFTKKEYNENLENSKLACIYYYNY